MKRLKAKLKSPRSSRSPVPFSKDILPNDRIIRFGIVRRISRRALADEYGSEVKEFELVHFVYVNGYLIYQEGGFDKIDDYDENGQVWYCGRLLDEIVFVTTAVSFNGLLDKYKKFNAYGIGEDGWARYNKGELPSA